MPSWIDKKIEDALLNSPLSTEMTSELITHEQHLRVYEQKNGTPMPIMTPKRAL